MSTWSPFLKQVRLSLSLSRWGLRVAWRTARPWPVLDHTRCVAGAFSAPPRAAHSLAMALSVSSPAPTIGPVGLPPLSCRPLAPACVSQRGQALVALGRIASVRVVRSPSGRLELHVFLPTDGSAPSHIPLRRVAPCGSPRSSIVAKEPTLTLDKPLAAFAELREQVTEAALAAHDGAACCDFCRELVNFTTWSHRVPSGLRARRLMLRRASEDAKLLALLTAFASELLAHTLRPEAGACEELMLRCQAHTRIPQLVRGFFLPTP